MRIVEKREEGTAREGRRGLERREPGNYDEKSREEIRQTEEYVRSEKSSEEREEGTAREGEKRMRETRRGKL